MTMRYFVASDYSGYYEAEEPAEITDIEVTQRPHPTCTWNGAAWVYDIDLARAYQYEKVLTAMRENYDAHISDNNLNDICVLGIIGMCLDRISYLENNGRSTDEIRFMKGYGAQLSYNMAQVAADCDAFFMLPCEVIGKMLAQRIRLMGQIAFEADPETVLTYNWVTI